MKKIQIIFLVIGMLLCLIPFAGMAFRPTTETTENRTLSESPSVTKEKGGLNTKFFEQFETWFQEHFAFRNEMVAADNRRQPRLRPVRWKPHVLPYPTATTEAMVIMRSTIPTDPWSMWSIKYVTICEKGTGPMSRCFLKYKSSEGHVTLDPSLFRHRCIRACDKESVPVSHPC